MANHSQNGVEKVVLDSFFLKSKLTISPDQQSKVS